MVIGKVPLQTKDLGHQSAWRERPKRTLRELAKLQRQAQHVQSDLVRVEDGWSYDLLLKPSVGLVSVLLTLAREHGPLDMEALVFSFSQASAEALVSEPGIRTMRLHIDAACTRRVVSAMDYVRERCASVRIVESHAKVTVLHDAARSLGFVVQGSANLSKNRGYEQVTIRRDYGAAMTWVEEMRHVPPYERGER